MSRRALRLCGTVVLCVTSIGSTFALVQSNAELAPIGAVETIEPPQPLQQYRGRSVLVGAAAAVWIAGLGALFLVRRRTGEVAPETTTIDEDPSTRLAVLARRGMAGELTVDESVELERLLLDRWSGPIHAGDPLARRVAIANSSAGEQYAELERWLYRGDAAPAAWRRLLEPVSRLDATEVAPRQPEATP